MHSAPNSAGMYCEGHARRKDVSSEQHGQPNSTPKPGLLDGYLTRDEVAAQFGVTKRTVSEWIGKPDGMAHAKVGKRYYFKIDDVRDWLARRVRNRNRTRSPRASQN